MAHSAPPVIITSSSGKPLNGVLEQILKSGLINLDIVEKIKRTDGRSAISADGDAPIEKLEIHINSKIYTVSSHEELRKKLQSIVDEHGDAILDDTEVVAFFDKVASE